MVEFRGTLNEQIYMRGHRLHGGSTRGLGIFLTVVGVLALYPTGPVALLLVAFGILLWMLPRIIAWNMFRDSALLRAPFSGHLDEQGYVAESENGRSNIAWEKFHGARAERDTIMLYASSRQFLLLPREFFASDADFAEAQELVRRYAKPRKNRAVMLALLLWFVILAGTFLLFQFASTP